MVDSSYFPSQWCQIVVFLSHINKSKINGDWLQNKCITQDRRTCTHTHIYIPAQPHTPIHHLYTHTHNSVKKDNIKQCSTNYPYTPNLVLYPFLCGYQTKNFFKYIFKWLRKLKEKKLWNVKIKWNSNFSVHKVLSPLLCLLPPPLFMVAFVYHTQSLNCLLCGFLQKKVSDLWRKLILKLKLLRNMFWWLQVWINIFHLCECFLFPTFVPCFSFPYPSAFFGFNFTFYKSICCLLS